VGRAGRAQWARWALILDQAHGVAAAVTGGTLAAAFAAEIFDGGEVGAVPVLVALAGVAGGGIILTAAELRRRGLVRGPANELAELPTSAVCVRGVVVPQGRAELRIAGIKGDQEAISNMTMTISAGISGRVVGSWRSRLSWRGQDMGGGQLSVISYLW
jgi:hypothetical protein